MVITVIPADSHGTTGEPFKDGEAIGKLITTSTGIVSDPSTLPIAKPANKIGSPQGKKGLEERLETVERLKASLREFLTSIDALREQLIRPGLEDDTPPL